MSRSRISAEQLVAPPFIALTFITFPTLCGASHWCNFIITFQDLEKKNEIPNFKSVSTKAQGKGIWWLMS